MRASLRARRWPRATSASRWSAAHGTSRPWSTWTMRQEDAALLKGMPKMKVEATWVPWTYSRLTRQSGYGAGIDSPGWYSHLWEHGERDHRRAG